MSLVDLAPADAAGRAMTTHASRRATALRRLMLAVFLQPARWLAALRGTRAVGASRDARV